MHTNKKSQKGDRKVGWGVSMLTVSLTVKYPFFMTSLRECINMETISIVEKGVDKNLTYWTP